MPTEVITQTKCSKCGAIHQEKGSPPCLLPAGWGHLELAIWDAAGIKQQERLDLCPACVRETMKFLGVPRKRTRKLRVSPTPEDAQDVPQASRPAQGEPAPVVDSQAPQEAIPQQEPKRKRGRPRKAQPEQVSTPVELKPDAWTLLATDEQTSECDGAASDWGIGPQEDHWQKRDEPQPPVRDD